MKMLKKIIFLLLIFVFILTIIIFLPREESKYPLGRNRIDYFGDGRFQISLIDFFENDKNDLLTLWDKDYYFEGSRVSKTLIVDIEKYIEKDPYIYLIGYYRPGIVGAEYEKLPQIAYNPETRKMIEFDGLKETPRYTIINYRTGEIEFYKTLEEVPKKDQKMFKKKAWFGCEFFLWRTCYEK